MGANRSRVTRRIGFACCGQRNVCQNKVDGKSPENKELVACKRPHQENHVEMHYSHQSDENANHETTKESTNRLGPLI